MSEHVLMTVLGINSQSTRYQLDGTEYCAPLAPIALFHLLRQKPTKILAFCTDQAEETTYQLLETELREHCTVVRIRIPEGETENSLDDFLKIFAQKAPRTGALTVEITHGYRHYALLMLLGAFYVSALREDLQLNHVYYAIFGKGNSPSPIVDLGRLLELSEWIHATNTFHTTGSAQPMANLIRQVDTSQNAQRMDREITALSQYLAEGLPLELGMQAQTFVQERIKPLRRLVSDRHLPRPFSNELTNRIREGFRSYATQYKAKKDIPLNCMELERQAQLIERLQHYGYQASAIGLMREWVVNWVLWQTDSDNWLSKHRRGAAERSLNLLTKLRHEEANHGLASEQKDLAEFWNDIRDLRNTKAHHGMRPSEVFDSQAQEQKRKVWQYWQDCLKTLPAISLDIVGGIQYERLIVSPLGYTPGVLYSTLRTCTPLPTAQDLCLVITSQEAAQHKDEALDRAGFPGEHKMLMFADPHAGLNERSAMLQQAGQYILAARETHVNITGGTTLMGVLVNEIARKAHDYQRLATRFALIDQRSSQDQRDHPYVVGERINIEGVEDDRL